MKSLLLCVLFISFILLSIPAIYGQNSYNNTTQDPFEWLKNLFNQGFNQAQDFGNYLLHEIVNFLIFLGRIIYIIVGLVGLILWASGLQPHKGKRFVIGAVLLAIIIEVLSKMLT
jgi:hypothetical protein